MRLVSATANKSEKCVHFSLEIHSQICSFVLNFTEVSETVYQIAYSDGFYETAHYYGPINVRKLTGLLHDLYHGEDVTLPTDVIWSPEELAVSLTRDGLIQFGRFVQEDGTIWPVAVKLIWLPSYPEHLRWVAAMLRSLVREMDADRLLTTVDAIPLGTALVLSTDIPMTYPYGEVRDYTAAYAIEGAYDVGHPTVLLADVLIDATQAEQITALARRVGLDVHTVLAVLDIGLGAREQLEKLGYGVRTVFTLRDALPVLEEHELLPPLMRQAVEAWLGEKRNGRQIDAD